MHVQLVLEALVPYEGSSTLLPSPKWATTFSYHNPCIKISALSLPINFIMHVNSLDLGPNMNVNMMCVFSFTKRLIMVPKPQMLKALEIGEQTKSLILNWPPQACEAAHVLPLCLHPFVISCIWQCKPLRH